MILLLGAMSISAQTSTQSEDSKTIELRQKIGIDYSMPDFNTSKIDGKVIGKRLAKMLRLLNEHVLDYNWSNKIIAICCEQHGNLRYATLEKFSIKQISKSGDVITIVMKLKLGDNSSGIKTIDVPVVFDKGVSESLKVNDLFSDLSRYIKE